MNKRLGNRNGEQGTENEAQPIYCDFMMVGNGTYARTMYWEHLNFYHLPKFEILPNVFTSLRRHVVIPKPYFYLASA